MPWLGMHCGCSMVDVFLLTDLTRTRHQRSFSFRIFAQLNDYLAYSLLNLLYFLFIPPRIHLLSLLTPDLIPLVPPPIPFLQLNILFPLLRPLPPTGAVYMLEAVSKLLTSALTQPLFPLSFGQWKTKGFSSRQNNILGCTICRQGETGWDNLFPIMDWSNHLPLIHSQIIIITTTNSGGGPFPIL